MPEEITNYTKHEFKNTEKMGKGAVDFVVWMLRKNIQPLTTDSTSNIVYIKRIKLKKNTSITEQ